MFTKEMVSLFEDYAREYNRDSDSKESDTTYDKLYEAVRNNFEGETIEVIMDTLCEENSNKEIDFMQNISTLAHGIKVEWFLD